MLKSSNNNNDNINFQFSSLGMITKKTENHIKRIPGSPCLQELQKIVLNGTVHLLRRVRSM